jgi:hypothetical protein
MNNNNFEKEKLSKKTLEKKTKKLWKCFFLLVESIFRKR